ncbi:MAG: lysozyme family protein [Lachnospiraceae bacterium]|nr:lysozyme family protein [Lachnospiraceae bacterium]
MNGNEMIKIIEGLSGSARNRFYDLSDKDKRKFLKKAKNVAEKLDSKTLEKQLDMRKRIRRMRGSKNKSLHLSSASNIESKASSTMESYVVAMEYMLTTGKIDGDDDSDVRDESYREMQSMMSRSSHVTKRIQYGRVASYRAIHRMTRKESSPITNSEISKVLVKRDVRKNAAKASRLGQSISQSAKSSAEAVKSFAEKTKEATKQLIKVMRKMANPLLLIGGLVIVVFSAVFVSLAAVVGASSGVASDGASDSYEAKVSAKTEAYRPLVEKYCDKYGIDDYVELVLAMIEQESGGNPPDVMQTEQSYYNTHPPIDSAEESIDCGTHELSDCLKSAKCKDPDDIAGIKLAIQGYNFGNGYIGWAIKNYKGYTEESAKVFSAKMKAQLHLSGYGDVEYVKHVLRYYVPIENFKISNESASKILKELKENNKASTGAWKVIEKGASLIGKVDYSMDKRQGDGRDNPKYLDCSSFTAWAFHKSGYSSVPYGSTTATFVESGKFETISADKLKVGDIGLNSNTTATGGSNHVGIYCGKLKNGTKVWLHCTSSSSTSLTGNTQGPMFGAYTNFTYFRCFKKFD